ncbi:MAG: class I SAM-dependent methyltransferase [Alphaproteobacteria bacterium]
MSRRGGDHAALMDRVYHYQRHFYDVTRRFFLFGRDRLLREMQPCPGDSIVEIGCGTARNLIKLATLYPGASLYGLDASREMLRTAQQRMGRKGLSSQISIAHGLAEDFSPLAFSRREKFDHTLFSYSLSMIPDWRAALRAAARATKPEGRVHIVDFGDLGGLFRPFACGLRAWLRLFHVTPRDELSLAVAQMPGASVAHLPGRYAFLARLTPQAADELSARP